MLYILWSAPPNTCKPGAASKTHYASGFNEGFKFTQVLRFDGFAAKK